MTLKTKIIIDTDPGIDDAMAILYAGLHPDINLLGLTTIFGNVTTEIATRNALVLAEMMNLTIPVAQGAHTPFDASPERPVFACARRARLWQSSRYAPERASDNHPCRPVYLRYNPRESA